ERTATEAHRSDPRRWGWGGGEGRAVLPSAAGCAGDCTAIGRADQGRDAADSTLRRRIIDTSATTRASRTRVTSRPRPPPGPPTGATRSRQSAGSRPGPFRSGPGPGPGERTREQGGLQTGTRDARMSSDDDAEEIGRSDESDPLLGSPPAGRRPGA